MSLTAQQEIIVISDDEPAADDSEEDDSEEDDYERDDYDGDDYDEDDYDEDDYEKDEPQEDEPAADEVAPDEAGANKPEPTLPGGLVNMPYLRYVRAPGKMKLCLQMCAPFYTGPSLDLLLFCKQTVNGYRFWKVFGNDQVPVPIPTTEHIIINHSAGNLKLLLTLYRHLQSRKQELIESWYEVRSHAKLKHILWRHPEVYESEDHIKVQPESVPKRLELVIPVYGKRGGILTREKGVTVERRLLTLRGTYVNFEDRGIWTRWYIDVSTSNTVEKEEGDLVVPESEECYKMLANFMLSLREEDLEATGPVDQPTKKRGRGGDDMRMDCGPEKGVKKTKMD